MTRIVRPDSWTAAITSSSSGSACAPGSFVRSSTAMVRTLSGITLSKASALNGRNRRTTTQPTLRPCAFSVSTTSRSTWVDEPMAITTSVASGAPK